MGSCGRKWRERERGHVRGKFGEYEFSTGLGFYNIHSRSSTRPTLVCLTFFSFLFSFASSVHSPSRSTPSPFRPYAPQRSTCKTSTLPHIHPVHSGPAQRTTHTRRYPPHPPYTPPAPPTTLPLTTRPPPSSPTTSTSPQSPSPSPRRPFSQNSTRKSLPSSPVSLPTRPQPPRASREPSHDQMGPRRRAHHRRASRAACPPRPPKHLPSIQICFLFSATQRPCFFPSCNTPSCRLITDLWLHAQGEPPQR
jgi:hypothetical protein